MLWYRKDNYLLPLNRIAEPYIRDTVVIYCHKMKFLDYIFTAVYGEPFMHSSIIHIHSQRLIEIQNLISSVHLYIRDRN